MRDITLFYVEAVFFFADSCIFVLLYEIDIL